MKSKGWSVRGSHGKLLTDRSLRTQTENHGAPMTIDGKKYWHCEDVQDRSLQAARNRNLFDLHLLALDWSLIEPIIINDQTDIKSSNWKDRGLKPFVHQVQNLVTFCKRLPVTLIADDVGLGKTISAGLILSELIARRRVSRVLIICPKILMPQWVSELDEKFGLVAKEVSGSTLKTEIKRSTPIVVTTYHSASTALADIEEGTFDLCILDEAHKLRNLYGNQKVPKMALNFRGALERRPFKYVLMLTATPIQNKVWDLYSLIDLLKVAEGKPNPLGNPGDFAEKFLASGTSGRKLDPAQSQLFQKIVRPSLTRTRRTDVKLNFPDRKIQMMRVQLQGPELEMIRVVGRLIEGLSALLQISLAQAMMSSPRALLAQSENMCEKGTISPKVLNELRDLVGRVPEPAKLKQVFSIIETLTKKDPANWRIVIFTVRRETQEMIGSALNKKSIQVGFINGLNHVANNRAIASYKEKPPKIHVLVSTDAGAEGINLQAGNILINYDLPWNPMIIEQRIGRIQRLGSEFSAVVIFNLVGAGTVEDHIVGRLTEKLQGVSQAIGDIEGILEAADIDPEDGEGSFESRVRKMVVDSLRGKDVAKSQKLLTDNIQEAKDLFEERRHDLDQQLGGDPNEGAPVNKPPKIERREPRAPAKEFVLNAKKALGFQIREVNRTLYEATKAGSIPEKISFDDEMLAGNQQAIFSEQPVKSFLPGKPSFERLVQHWVDHHAHHVIDKSSMSHDQAVIVAKSWCSKNTGMEYVSANFKASRPFFAGIVHIRIKAGTGVDGYEKILKGKISKPSTHGEIHTSPSDQLINKNLAVSQIMSTQYQPIVKKVVENDQDVGKFCSYYINRLVESLRQTGPDPIKRAKVESDFRPYVQADVVGIDGIRYEGGEIDIQFMVDGHSFSTTINAIPASGAVLTEPKLVDCEVTGARVPDELIGKCSSTNKNVLTHRLIKISGNRLVLADQVVTCFVSGDKILKAEAVQAADGSFAKKDYLNPCEFTGEMLLPGNGAWSEYSKKFGRKNRLLESQVTGKKGFPEEIVECSATGRKMFPDEGVLATSCNLWFAKDQLVKSVMSGRLGLPTEMAQCEKTGDKVLPDEIGTCAISGKRVRVDLLHESPESGRKFLPEHGLRLTDGKYALPDEVLTCDQSGAIAHTSEFGKCTSTGKTVLLKYLSRSAASGNIYLAEVLKTTDEGQFGLPEEIAACEWDGKTTLKKFLIECTLSGLMISQKYMNQDRQLKVLRELLDSRISGSPVPDETVRKLALLQLLKAIRSGKAAMVMAPLGTIYALIFEEKASWFTSKLNIYGALIRTSHEGEMIAGKLVIGERKNGLFVAR